MSRQEPIQLFEEYIQKLTNDLDLDDIEISEIEEEWKQHLYDHYEVLIKQGVESSKAVSIVIEQFGEIEMLQNEVNHTYPSSVRNHVQKEILIAMVCLIACITGPWLLIGAHFDISFILAPMQALVIAYLIYRFIIKRQTYWLFSIVGSILLYLVFLKFFTRFYGEPLTFNVYISHLFSLEWDRLTGSNGLFEIVTIHMMWYITIASQIMSKDQFIPLWQRISNTTFHYWAMVIIAIFVARFQSSAEWAVLFMNVFLLYVFLQQTLSNKTVLITKQKLSRFTI
ncbi:hypothetical protein ACFYKX_05475 [Cytobacillus sp. FJAT-54145]|uniref:DUF1700 domain-containing protein n=1 Tax=Cytobacillus spartinae TaxID=3299023 RepID=A0ABW6KBB4_9BACI